MTRSAKLLALLTALALTGGLAVAAEAQDAQRSRRGSGRGLSRSSLLGLLSLEQVQKEVKITEEQQAKIKKISDELTAEATKQYAALREIEDDQKRRAKYSELSDEMDRKSREMLQDVLPREQMTRLYQIRLQVRAVVDSLGNRYVAGKLKLTDEQKKQVAAIDKDVQAKRGEFYASMREASQEQRSEAYQKYRKMRSDAEEKALALLTAEQKKAFEEMKGEKIEIQTVRTMGRSR